MREERKDKIFGKMERLYSKKKYIGENIKFEECDEIGKRI